MRERNETLSDWDMDSEDEVEEANRTKHSVDAKKSHERYTFRGVYF